MSTFNIGFYASAFHNVGNLIATVSIEDLLPLEQFVIATISICCALLTVRLGAFL
ncbi:9034_t:CDS:2 [Gigaspora margarita]|uniref:9034_t:CDS:1 n=1 Tax=Gigaspora margarita TaxID=4874 RepID=A0ABN7ULB7_GIGMA|nr:9034_t:CDS:2 [Gigaspora margarita]